MTFKLYSDGQEVSDRVLLKPFASDEAIEIFESLRTYGHRIFRLDEHVKRFMESAKTAGFHHAIQDTDVKRNLQQALKAFIKTENPNPDEEFFLRVTWMPRNNLRDRSPGRRGLTGKLFVMVGQRKHPVALYKEGVALQTTVVKRSPSVASPSQAKTSDYINAVMATLDPKPEGVYEWLFLDRFGFVTEVRIGNIFMVKDGVLLTPPTTGILNGVTRRFVIECALTHGIPVREIPLTRHEFYNADEAFLTNTSWEILPVRQLDGRRIGKKIPGSLSHQLQKTFKQRALQECQSKPSIAH